MILLGKLKEKYHEHKRYLPSRRFVFMAGGGIVLATIIFVVFFMPSGGENFSAEEDSTSLLQAQQNQTLLEMVQSDLDQDTIPDWEEALWGTDKNKKVTFDGIPDSMYIADKKKELNITQSASVEEKRLTETEKFAREFFTSYSAMKSSGQVDSGTINNFSSSLGQKIANPDLADKYTKADIKIAGTDTPATWRDYYIKVQKLFQEHQSAGLGEELGIVSTGVSPDGVTLINTSEQKEKLQTIANGYKDFGKKVMDTSVPAGLSDYHLQIANSAHNTGVSVLNLEKMSDDPIVGLSGLSQYQKYSEEFVKSVGDLETALLKE